MQWWHHHGGACSCRHAWCGVVRPLCGREGRKKHVRSPTCTLTYYRPHHIKANKQTKRRRGVVWCARIGKCGRSTDHHKLGRDRMGPGVGSWVGTWLAYACFRRNVAASSCFHVFRPTVHVLDFTRVLHPLGRTVMRRGPPNGSSRIDPRSFSPCGQAACQSHRASPGTSSPCKG